MKRKVANHDTIALNLASASVLESLRHKPMLVVCESGSGVERSAKRNYCSLVR